MNRFKCPACGRNQYTSKDEADYANGKQLNKESEDD